MFNAAMQLRFRDSAISIGSPADGDLDINADDEIELNSTLIDVNGNLDVSGTGVIAGAVTTAALTASGIIKTDDTTAATSTTDGSLQTDGGLSVAADAVIGDDLFLLSDAAVQTFGADKDVTLTHVADTGLLLNSTMAIQFNDASQFIKGSSNAILDLGATDKIGLTATLIEVNGNQTISGTLAQADAITMATNKKIIFRDAAIHISSTADGDLSIAADDEIDLTSTLIDVNGNLDVSGTYTGAGVMTTGGNVIIPDAGTIGSANDHDAIAIGSDGDVTLTQDLELQHDGAILSFGANDEVTLTHVHNSGLELKHTATADDKPIVLTLATGETDMAANDVMGKIQFQAPDEATGTDAVLVAAAIQARSEGDFSSSVNATSLDFMTGASEAAATRMTITSAGNVAIGEASTTARLDVYKSTAVYAEISNATNGHYFEAQSDDNTDAFEIYQQHGSNTTRNSFVVTDNHTGSKGESFLVRGDGRVGIGTSAPDSLLEISSGATTTAKIATTVSNNYAELIFEDGNAGYGFQVRSDGAQSIAVGSMVINDRDTGSFPFVLAEGAPTETLKIESGAVYIGRKVATRLRGVSPNSNTGEQQFRVEWWNENEAGIMAKIGCNRTQTTNAPAALVFFTNANVDTTANSSEGDITEHFRIGADGTLTATDTSITSNSDLRLKKNIENYSYSLEDFKKYKPKTFDWKNPEKHGNKSNLRGFVAQEVQEIDSRYVDGIEIRSDNPDFYLLTKTEDNLEDEKTALTSYLGSKDAMYISVIQQLVEKIEVLETKMIALEK